MCCSPTFWSCYLSSYSLNRQTLEIVSLPNFSISLDICFFTSRIQYSLFNFQVTVNLVKDSWWAQVDSNHRPHAYQACALTTWAMRPFGFQCLFVPLCSLLKVSLERWWRWGGSNSWPPACKAGALPAELHPHCLTSSFFNLPFFLSGILKIEQCLSLLSYFSLSLTF